MNPLQIIQQTACNRFPSVTTELLEPLQPSGRWILELELDGWSIVAGWLPGREIGISASSVAAKYDYGTGFDEIFSETDAEKAYQRVLTLLENRESSNSPPGVALKEIRPVSE